MYKTISPSDIGHGKSLKDAAEAVSKVGFEGYWLNISEDSKIPVEETNEILKKYNLKAAGFTLPVEFRRDKETFERGLNLLEERAKYAQKIGVRRCVTWILPTHDSLDYNENFELHRTRLTQCCEILKEYNILFGMEFVGTPSIRKDAKHIFIYDLDKMFNLCDAIGTGNVGILMDIWHWDLSGHTTKDFAKFTNPDQVVLVHINDAPLGTNADEQIDSIRKLPGETGVLNIKDFFNGLKSINYKGPVLAEPFEKSLHEMSFESAIKKTIDAINKVWI